MKTQLSKNTVFQFFSGQANALQKRLIEEWLREPGSFELYYEWLEEWEREHPQYVIDTDAATGGFLQKLDSTAAVEKASHVTTSFRGYRWMGYAASIAIVMCVCIFLGFDYIRFKHYVTGFGEVSSVQLSDGSRVTLNANSTLRVPRLGFGSATREVFLLGEAEFSVVHTSNDAKFIVNTPDKLQVEVLGTEFVVYSRARGSKVVLNKGRVVLHAMNDTVPIRLAIKPGDVVTLQKGAFRVKEKQNTAGHNAWKEHRFVFDRTPLSEIAFQVEENFGVQLQISDTLLAKRELSGTYEAANAADILEVIARVLNVEVRRAGNQIVLQNR